MSEQNSNPFQDAAPEEIEAAMAANAADELQRLQVELAELKAKSAELADQFLRAKAEAENVRRRAEDEVSKARKFGIESFAESLLPVCDSLDAALAIQQATPEQLREGADATLRQLTSALERNKVVPSTRQPARNSTPTCTRPSAWCLHSRKPTPWCPCCKRAT